MYPSAIPENSIDGEAMCRILYNIDLHAYSYLGGNWL
jgi:hypothetical protein